MLGGMSQKKTERPVLKPAAAVKGRPISEDDDFGEQTYARALKAVTETITNVEKKVSIAAKPAAAKVKRSR